MGVILVAVDFDGGAREAIEYAKAEAARMGAEVVLVHAYQLPEYAYPGFEPAPAVLPVLSNEVQAAAKKALEELAHEHDVRGIVRGGDAAEEILATARETGAELIVMTTHGRKGLSHLLLGSVTEKVIRKSRVPVLVVPLRPAEAA